MNGDKRDKNTKAWAAKTDAQSDKLFQNDNFLLAFQFWETFKLEAFPRKVFPRNCLSTSSASHLAARFSIKNGFFPMQNRGKVGRSFEKI